MDNLWIIMALITAFAGGTSDALTKRALLKHDVYAIAWLRQLIVVILLSPFLFIIPIPQLNEDSFRASLTALPFEVIAYIFFMKAIVPGIFTSITAIVYSVAMSLANIAYMVAISRLSLIVGVIYGHFLFQEAGFRERLTGTILMLIGFSIIAFGQR